MTLQPNHLPTARAGLGRGVTSKIEQGRAGGLPTMKSKPTDQERVRELSAKDLRTMSDQQVIDHCHELRQILRYPLEGQPMQLRERDDGCTCPADYSRATGPCPVHPGVWL